MLRTEPQPSGVDLLVREVELPPGSPTVWHYHSYLTETVYCLKGTVTVSGQHMPTLTLSPGNKAEFSAMQPHAIGNPGNAPAAYLLVQRGHYDFIGCSQPDQTDS